MTDIINPHTNRSTSTDKLLSALQTWTTCPPVIRALLYTRKITVPLLKILAHRISCTLDPHPYRPRRDHLTGKLLPTACMGVRITPLNEEEVAGLVFCFLENSQVRKVIAKTLTALNADGAPKTVEEVFKEITELRDAIDAEWGILRKRAEAGARASLSARTGLIIPN